MPRQSHLTQWAAQFAVASELCKRSYQVALTLGNHPSVDLMVSSPQNINFEIDVKGLYKHNYFLLKPKPSRTSLFYVLAYVPIKDSNQFFILSQTEANLEIQMGMERARERQIKNGKTSEKLGAMPAISWKTACLYRDRWDILPA